MDGCSAADESSLVDWISRFRFVARLLSIRSFSDGISFSLLAPYSFKFDGSVVVLSDLGCSPYARPSHAKPQDGGAAHSYWVSADCALLVWQCGVGEQQCGEIVSAEWDFGLRVVHNGSAGVAGVICRECECDREVVRA